MKPFSMKWLRTASLIIATLLAVSTTPSYAADETCRGTTLLNMNEITAQVELAIDPKDRSYGLMFRAKMGQNCGMLFVFETNRPRVFTMRNTLIPLDIAFIDTDGRIAEILTMEPGGDRYPSSVAASFALEMNKGWFEANEIKVDDVISIVDGDGEKQTLESTRNTK